jgi:hypothetical protein
MDWLAGSGQALAANYKRKTSQMVCDKVVLTALCRDGH